MNDEREIRLYPFTLRDPISGRVYVARWKASADEIAKLGGEICGEPEVRRVSPASGDYFKPHRDPIRKPAPVGDVVLNPDDVDDAEKFIARAFLRRLTTYYVRRGRHAQAQGAARLWRDLA